MGIRFLKEIISILMESNSYFRLTLKERKELIGYFLRNITSPLLSEIDSRDLK
ncbi:MAG: hypothetical protein KBE27_00710 [Syntrophorhabdaceae bacterium]|nr:hypothetical protein [Syntrophorhabdales bacterium]MBP9560322.1 hypothetical protein [Syntrophorhabdaceae bacterium]